MKRDARPKMMSFSQLPAVKDTYFWWASQTNFCPSYFVTALEEYLIVQTIRISQKLFPNVRP